MKLIRINWKIKYNIPSRGNVFEGQVILKVSKLLTKFKKILLNNQ